MIEEVFSVPGGALPMDLRQIFYRRMLVIRLVEQRLSNSSAWGKYAAPFIPVWARKVVRSASWLRWIGPRMSFVPTTGAWTLFGLFGRRARLDGRGIGFAVGGMRGYRRKPALAPGQLLPNGDFWGCLPSRWAWFAPSNDSTGRGGLRVSWRWAMAEGGFYEALNLAGLWRLPLLFAVEHNGYAKHPSAEQHAGDLPGRARTFGVPVTVVDGNDVEQVYANAGAMVQRIRGDRVRNSCSCKPTGWGLTAKAMTSALKKNCPSSPR